MKHDEAAAILREWIDDYEKNESHVFERGHDRDFPALAVRTLLEGYEQLVTDICELEPCRCCKYDDDCEGSNSIGCTTGGFEFRDPDPGREGK